jgi:hypothetical protein
MDLITAVGGEQAFEMIVDLAVKEAVHLILSSKCFLWSRPTTAAIVPNRLARSTGWAKQIHARTRPMNNNKIVGDRS